ncbi:MAG: alpha/beta fold hydrolase [Candidatus Marinimicrobia bacterium]|nr:alpha/beta fold hydrolase [Candidatus Neomarinimicrobiota bacterium]
MTNFLPSPFEPAPWLPNGHFQSVFASLFMPVKLPRYRREILDLPDGDIIAADWIDGPADAPLVVLIHGMEGSSESRYARLLMNESHHRGWRGVVLHMRSCGGLMNRLRQFYHAGFYQDIEYFLDTLLPSWGIHQKVYLLGVSLGGSQVAHYLARGNARERVKAAVIISAPLDLAASADFMSIGFSRRYVAKFRNSLLKKYHLKSELIDDANMAKRLARAKTFWDLDNAATAPIHGFRDAAHYYAEMSAKNCLKDIPVSTLYLASRDDPFVPEASMPQDSMGSRHFASLLTEQGGHVGFVDRLGKSWMVSTVFKFLTSV